MPIPGTTADRTPPVIVVAGDALVDLIVRPDGGIVALAGGGSFNACRAIARLGVPSAFLGGLSRDRFGRMLEAGLAEDDVDLGLVQWTELPTTLALAELGGDGVAQYHFYTEGTSAPAVVAGALPAALGQATRAVLVGTLGLVLEPMASTLEGWTLALPADVLVMVDPNCRPSITRDPDGYRARMARVLPRADIVKASVEDLAFLRPGEDRRAAIAWIESLGPSVVVITDGGAPVAVRIDGAEHSVIPPTVRVVDTVGAGDTFGGAMLACLVHNGTTRATLVGTAAILRAARFGVRASAMVCERAGAKPPTLDELGGWPA